MDWNYRLKRPSIELLCRDVEAQCQLLAKLLDGELEDTSLLSSGIVDSAHNEEDDCKAADTPPTIVCNIIDSGVVSPGLELLHTALVAALATSPADARRSITGTVRALANAFRSHTGLWTVGLGLEPQLNRLCAAAGLPALLMQRPRCLDYALLVRPQVTVDTLTREEYRHAEDFFFRTVHLGTECWAFIAGSRLRVAVDYARDHEWRQSALQIDCAAHVLEYLGDHVLMVRFLLSLYHFICLRSSRKSHEWRVQVFGRWSLSNDYLRCAW